MCIQSDVKAWAWFGGARPGDPAQQIIVKLLRNQPFLVQCPISLHLLAQGRLAEKTDFQGRYVVGVLTTQRIEGIVYPVATLLDDLAAQLGDALAKHRDQAPAIKGQEPVDQKPHNQQQLDAVCQALRKKSHDPEMPVQEIGNAECDWKGEPRLAGPAVSDAAFGPGALDQRIPISQ